MKKATIIQFIMILIVLGVVGTIFFADLATQKSEADLDDMGVGSEVTLPTVPDKRDLDAIEKAELLQLSEGAESFSPLFEFALSLLDDNVEPTRLDPFIDRFWDGVSMDNLIRGDLIQDLKVLSDRGSLAAAELGGMLLFMSGATMEIQGAQRRRLYDAALDHLSRAAEGGRVASQRSLGIIQGYLPFTTQKTSIFTGETDFQFPRLADTKSAVEWLESASDSGEILRFPKEFSGWIDLFIGEDQSVYGYIYHRHALEIANNALRFETPHQYAKKAAELYANYAGQEKGEDSDLRYLVYEIALLANSDLFETESLVGNKDRLKSRLRNLAFILVAKSKEPISTPVSAALFDEVLRKPLRMRMSIPPSFPWDDLNAEVEAATSSDPKKDLETNSDAVPRKDPQNETPADLVNAVMEPYHEACSSLGSDLSQFFDDRGVYLLGKRYPSPAAASLRYGEDLAAKYSQLQQYRFSKGRIETDQEIWIYRTAIRIKATYRDNQKSFSAISFREYRFRPTASGLRIVSESIIEPIRLDTLEAFRSWQHTGTVVARGPHKFLSLRWEASTKRGESSELFRIPDGEQVDVWPIGYQKDGITWHFVKLDSGLGGFAAASHIRLHVGVAR